MGREVNKFNLTFTGETLPGYDPDRVKAAFGDVLSVKDAAQLDQLFSGQTVILKRDLARKEAATLYAQLRKAGADVALDKIIDGAPQAELFLATPAAKPEPAPDPAPAKKSRTAPPPANRGMDHEIREAHPGRIDQSWPIPANPKTRKPIPSAGAPKTKKSSPAKKATPEPKAKTVTRPNNIKAEKEATKEQKKIVEESLALRKEAEKALQNARDEEARVIAAGVASAKAEEVARLKAAEDAARTKAEEETAQRKVVEDAARAKAEEEAAQRKVAEDAARAAKAQERAEARKRKTAENAAKAKALREEAKKKALQEAAIARAQREEAKKKAAEEASRLRAEREEAKKQAAEEAANARALKEEAKRLAAEKTAQEKALREAARKKATEEKALLRAEKEEAMRIAAEDAAIARALREEKKKKTAERAAKAKTLREQAIRKAAEEAVKADAIKREALREAALEAARSQSEQAERALLQEAEKARLKAADKQQKEAQRALLLEQKHQAAAEKARLKEEKTKEKQLELDLAEEQKRRHAEEFARLREQKAIEKAQREALERAAREKTAQEALRMEVLQAEQRRLEAEEEARIQSEKLAQLHARETQEQDTRKAQQQVLQEKSTIVLPERRKQGSVKDSATNSVVPQNISRSSTSRQPVKTSLNVPKRERRKSGEGAGRTSKQSGAPNFFTLRPFRNSPKISQRAARSQGIKQVAFTASLVAFLALTILSVRFITLPEAAGIAGASAILTNQKSQLLLQADDSLLLHDRSGVQSTAVTFDVLGLPLSAIALAFTTDDKLLLDPGSTFAAANDGVTLARCDIEQPVCEPLPLPAVIEMASAVAIEPRTGALYIADALAGEIFKVSRQGELIAWTATKIPSQPTVRLHDGLLFMNSAVAPAISVFRPDNQAFGEQLDEVLLLPPAAVSAQQTQVQDFVWSADHWWVTLANPDTGQASVYRFDEQWNYVSRPALKNGSQPEQLLSWADKTLILDSKRKDIQRFNAQGNPEAPFASESLQVLIDDHQHTRVLTTTLWYFALGSLTLLATLFLCVGLLHRLQNLIYRPSAEKGAEPVEEHSIRWVAPEPKRSSRIKRVSFAYGLCAVAALTVVTILTSSKIILLAAAIALSGPAFALFLFHSGRPGHIGVVDKKLLVVDHNNLYHLGQGPRIFYRKHFVMVDDVAVFTGTAALPVFDPGPQTNELAEIVSAGIKVDRKTVFIKLLQSGHPVARGALSCLATTVLAALTLLAL